MESNENKKILLELANRIKELRDERKLTQSVCYEDTGINFGRIERGVRDISFTTLLKICRYFKVPISEFLKDIF